MTVVGLCPSHMPVRSSNVKPVLLIFLPLANCGGDKEGTTMVACQIRELLGIDDLSAQINLKYSVLIKCIKSGWGGVAAEDVACA